MEETKIPTLGEVVTASLDIGEALLCNGGEIHRVEDTVQRILEAFGVADCEVFAITSIITVSAVRDGDQVTMVRRVHGIGTDFGAIEEANEVSRRLCAHGISPAEASERARGLGKIPKRKRWTLYLGAFVGSGCFSVFFGGGWLDGLFAAVIGFMIVAFRIHKPAFINRMLQTLVTSFVAGIVSYSLGFLGLPLHTDKIIIGEIMLMIPGLALGNAVRELLIGDIISGSLRVIYSVLQASMIAFGYMSAMLVFGGVI